MINLNKARTKMPEQDPAIRTGNFDEVATGYTQEMAVREALRCLKCREHPCQTRGCPVHNHIPEFIEKITEGDFEGAYRILTETTSLPAVCGRVCPQYLQCEGNCVRGEKGRAVAIGALERFVADWHRYHADAESAVFEGDRDGRRNPAEDAAEGSASTSGVEAATESAATDNATAAGRKKVAVIGSGPAGLGCADVLANSGCDVTVYDKAEVPGGVLAYGIPRFRLPAEVLENALSNLAAAGVRFEMGKELGKDFTLDDLEKQGFNAVFLGNGACESMRLGVPGQELQGVIPAADFLYNVNCKNEYPDAERIAIIGGGNVAMDACRAAVRCPSAKKVTVVYRRSVAEMPADPAELAEAEAEGVEFLYLTGPVEVLTDGQAGRAGETAGQTDNASGRAGESAGQSGKVAGLKCRKMALTEPDASGRRRPVPVPDSEFVLDVDCIIEAIGSRSDNTCADGVTVTDRGLILVDEETYATSRPGVYAGGDTVTGPKTVIAAMAAGRRAAAAILV